YGILYGMRGFNQFWIFVLSVYLIALGAKAQHVASDPGGGGGLNLTGTPSVGAGEEAAGGQGSESIFNSLATQTNTSSGTTLEEAHNLAENARLLEMSEEQLKRQLAHLEQE